MLISERHQKVVLNLRDPARVTTVIPTAKTFDYKGRTLVAVPHRRDEIKVLQNLGIKAPAPVRHYYDWAGTNDPFHAQRETAAMLTMEPRAYVLNGMGTGKTLAVCWSYDYLREVGTLRKMLVVAPLSTLDPTWLATLETHFFHLRGVVLHGSRARRLRLLEEDADVFIINHDGLGVSGLVEAIHERGDIDLITLDELAVFRNGTTARWKTANALCNPKKGAQPWVWGLTGTPTPNAPTDAWAQCRLISPHTVPKYYGQFRDQVMRQVGPFKWEPRDSAIEIVRAAMTPAVRYSMDDCVDLPEQLYQTREVGMSPEQQRAYNDMLNRLKAEYEGDEITASNEAIKASKLLQICCIAAGTPVLTRRGWLPIERVTPLDHVWDGVEWVKCGGSVYQGVKPVVECAGVSMTRDHEVLTVNGWATAEEVVYGNAGEGLDRAEVRLPDGYSEVGHVSWQDEEGDVAVSVRLREHRRTGESKSARGTPPERTPLWVSARGAHKDAWYGADASVQNLDEHEAPVRRPLGQRLAQVWWSGYKRMRDVAGIVQRLLGGHADRVLPAAHTGSDRQRRWVLPGELPLGDTRAAGKQHQEQRVAGYPEGTYDAQASSGGVRAVGRHTVSAVVPVRLEHGARADNPRGTAVYDIINCGPRRRFVVRGKRGELSIVHNCGAAYSNDGGATIIPATPRLEELVDTIEQAEAKVIVFVPFTAALEHVAAHLSERWPVEVVHGGTSKHERDTIFGAFQNENGGPKVLVAEPRTMAHGLTLTAASVIVWFAPCSSNETYQQACARVRRPGQTRTTLIVHLCGSAVERKAYARLEKKQSMQGALLDLFKEDTMRT